MHSFIIRVYRRGVGGGLSGTVQPVGTADQLPPQAFASTAELLWRLQAAPAQAGRQGADMPEIDPLRPPALPP